MKFQRYLHHILLIQTLPGAIEYLRSTDRGGLRHLLSSLHRHARQVAPPRRGRRLQFRPLDFTLHITPACSVLRPSCVRSSYHLRHPKPSRTRRIRTANSRPPIAVDDAEEWSKDHIVRGPSFSNARSLPRNTETTHCRYATPIRVTRPIAIRPQLY
jgi:hypothetical protein